MGAQQAVGPVLNVRISGDLREIAADQREVMVLVGAPDALDALHGSARAHLAAECVAGIGRVDDEPVVAQDFDHLQHQAALRIDGCILIRLVMRAL